MQLSPNQKIFAEFFSPFAEFSYNLKYFETKMSLKGYFFFHIIDCKKPGYLNAEKAPYQKTCEQSSC